MIDLSAYRGQRIAVLGLGKSGLPTASALRASGADVVAWDDGEKARSVAADTGVPIVDPGRDFLTDARLLVLSPGIPHDHPRPHPVARRARENGVPIVCDIELLYRAQPDATYVGITGTNGKSTTTALVTHVLNRAGRRAVAGGNIGAAALSLEPLATDGIYVLEMSSYQLELIPSVTFDVAALLNISPDHLDRHGGLHPYVAAKMRIFHGQDRDDTAVIGTDDRYSASIAAELARSATARVIPISATRPAPCGVSAEGGVLCDDIGGGNAVVSQIGGIPTLPGSHNWQNAAAAYAIARALCVPADAAIQALADYPGLPHRQELVTTIGAVRYVNDSKATNADSTSRALACYDDIYWIAGGLPKEGGITSLAPLFDRVRHAFLVGTAAPAFAETLGDQVPWTISGDLLTATERAHQRAQREGRAGAVVLLSPACASFDQWPNFEARGNAFRDAVRALAGSVGRAA